MSFLYAKHRLIQREITPKVRKSVILVHDTSSRPVLHFYQVSSIYSKGYTSYRADKKFYADVDANGIRPKNNDDMMIGWPSSLFSMFYLFIDSIISLVTMATNVYHKFVMRKWSYVYFEDVNLFHGKS